MIGKWFSRGHRPFDKKRHSSKKLARKSVKLLLETLEVRLAPAGVDLLYGDMLTVTASTTVKETITVTAPSANTLNIAITGDSISLGSGATGSNFALTNNNSSLTIKNINGSGPSVTNFNLILPNISAFSDTLTFGLMNTVAGSPNITIGGPNSPASPDTHDTVTLNSLSVSGFLNVSAETINFQQGGTVSAYDLALTSVNSLTFPSTGVPYQGAVTINGAPPSGQLIAGDPYITGPDWGAYGYAPDDEITITNATNVSSKTDYTVQAIIGDNLYLAPTPAIPSNAIASNGGQVNDGDVTVAPAHFTPIIQGSGLQLTATGQGSSISGAIEEPELDASTQNGNITLQNVGGAGAEVSFIATGGAITSVTPTPAAGGSGYPANSTFDLEVTGGGGIGGLVLATTNSSGVVTSFAKIPDSAGNGYSTTGAANTTNLLTIGALNAGTGSIQLDVDGSIGAGGNMTAGAVNLMTTGTGGSIGFSDNPITTKIDGELTATTNDGGVYIADSGPGLTINSVVADQGGQAPVVSNGQIFYNSMPSNSTPTYASGDEDVSISSTGPIVLNSVSATDDVTIESSAYILEGNAQSPNIIAQEVSLIAGGTGDYQGQVTFANTKNATTGDTMTLPATITTPGGSTVAGPTWSKLGFAKGDSIFVAGAIDSADKGVFTIASVAGYVLTLTQSYVLAPETQPGVTVSDGMIGLLNAAISLSDVPIFVATTANGDIYLETGAAVNSTADYVSAGGMNGMTNNVSVTSQANFLTIENIIATGNAAVAMNSGSLLEYSAENITGQNVSLTSPYNIGTALSPFQTNATSGLTVAATTTSPSSAAIYVDNTSSLASIGVVTYDGSATIQSGYNGSNYAGKLSFANNVLSETGNAIVTLTNTDYQDGSAGDVIISGPVYVSGISAGIGATGAAGAGQILSETNATIDGGGGTLILSAASGIGNPGTSIDVTDLTTLDATTTTGGIYVRNTSLSAVTLSASTSNGNIDVRSSGEIDLSNESSGTPESVSTNGTVTLDAGGAIVDENGSTIYASTLMLTATDGIGTSSSPLEISSPGTPTLTASAGDGLFLDNNMALIVNSSTAGNGDLSISSNGNLTLQGNVSSTNGNVTLTASDGTLTTLGSVLLSADSLTITAEQIGSTNDIIQTNATTIDVAANFGGIYLSNNNSGDLTLSAAAVGPVLSSGQTNNITIYSKGNIVLLPQTTNLTELATTVPVAVFNPGGLLALLAGATLSAGNAIRWSSSATTTSADAGDTTPYYDVWTGNYDIDGIGEFDDSFGGTSNGGLDFEWTVQSGSFTVDPASQTATATGTSGINLAVVTSGYSINSVNESAQATISGTLASGQNAGLVALFTSPDTYYYGSIAATSSSAYTASIYSVVNGNTTQLGTPQSYNGLVTNAVLEFSVAGSSLTLLLNGKAVASATSSSITTAGIVGMLASSGVSFTNFSSAPSLQIERNTSEVLVLPGGASSKNTLLELTASELEAGGTFIGGTIEIEDLGASGQPGTVNVAGNLVLDATAGPITFENTLDTIDATGQITIAAYDVADIGNITTTGGNITISAGGNIGVGTINAGTGTVLMTSSSGAIFNSKNGSSTLSVTAGKLALQSSAQSNSSGQSASSAASAAQSASIQDQLDAAEAAATAQAAAAVVAADQTTAAAFQAALTSTQAAVATDNQAYQADVQTTTGADQTANTEQNVVNADSIALDVLDGIAGGNQVLSASLSIAAAFAEQVAAFTLDIPGLDTVDLSISSGLNLAAALAGLTEGIADVSIFIASSALTAATIQLINDQGAAATAQSAQDQANARLQADMDTETAFAAAYNVAEQAYTSALATSNQDQTASEAAQQAAALAEANATAAANAASVAAATTSPTLNVTGPVNISNAQGAAGINWTNSIVSTSTVTEQSQGPLTISGVTIQSDSSVTLTAASNVNIASGSAIEAASTSPITITANTNDASSGTTVTLDGTLSAQSASIGVDPNATGNETFTITPSATTPITVNGGSDSGGDNALNYNAAGLAPTLSETMLNNEVAYTITAPGVAPVTFMNIEVVNITNAAGSGSLTLMGLSGQANAMSLVGTGQGAGTATLNRLAISFSGVTSFSYQGGGAAGGAGDTITVTPFVTSHWNLAVMVAGGSGTPASLTYNSVDSLADAVTATAEYAGSIASPGLAMIQFSNVNAITTNASQSRGGELTVNLPDGSSLDSANLLSVGAGTADINLIGLFGLNVDTADYAGLTLNGNSVGSNNLDLVTSTAAGLSIPLTLNSPDMHSVVNTGAATSVAATASGDVIGVTSAGLVTVTDLFGNVSSFAVTNTQLVFSDLGNNDTINIAGNNSFTNGIYVDGNASFSDVINYTAGSNAAVTVVPSTSTVSQAGAGAVFYSGIQSVNLMAASGSTSTLTVNGAATTEAFDFTQTSASAGSFTIVGPVGAINVFPLFTYTGFGNSVGVEGGTSPGSALKVKTMTGNVATVTGYSYVNESVSAMTTLTNGQYAGLIARDTAAGQLDLGFVVAGSKGYTAYIFRDDNGALKSLFKQTYSGSVAANSTLVFDAEGPSLILSLNGQIIGQATDTVLASTAGSVGMWTSSGAVMSNFVAVPVTLQAASNASVAVSGTINTLKTGQGVGSVRRFPGKHGHAHRAKIVRQSGHVQLRQGNEAERQRHHHSE